MEGRHGHDLRNNRCGKPGSPILSLDALYRVAGVVNQHFISISGGKDSLLTAIRAKNRFERRPPDGNLPPRYLACDTGNEEKGWHSYIDYMANALAVDIEIVQADFAREFEVRRANLHKEWSVEKRIRKHTAKCKALADLLPRKDRMALCDCPMKVYPPITPELIDRAIQVLVPSGNPFLDLCMLKGRFPGAKSRFCTDRLKIEPMMAIKQPLLDGSVNVIEWIGERAEESPSRARKPTVQRVRHMSGATQVLYRPIHGLLRAEVFAEIEASGIKPNPLYARGARRVGCWPCMMCGKDEIQMLGPEDIDRLAEWEFIASQVSRRGKATFFHAPASGFPRDGIAAVVEWSATTRGGRQFQMFQNRDREDGADRLCDRELGLCE